MSELVYVIIHLHKNIFLMRNRELYLSINVYMHVYTSNYIFFAKCPYNVFLFTYTCNVFIRSMNECILNICFVCMLYVYMYVCMYAQKIEFLLCNMHLCEYGCIYYII